MIVPDPTGEFPFAPEDYALHLVSAIAQLRDSALDGALSPFGLNVTRYRVLAGLNGIGVMSMTELAGFLGLDRTTLTRVADQLVAEGLVVRVAAPSDRRQVLLEITEPGGQLFKAAVSVLIAANAGLTEGLEADETRAAARTLKRIVANLTPTAAARSLVLDARRLDAGSAPDGPT